MIEIPSGDLLLPVPNIGHTPAPPPRSQSRSLPISLLSLLLFSITHLPLYTMARVSSLPHSCHRAVLDSFHHCSAHLCTLSHYAAFTTLFLLACLAEPMPVLPVVLLIVPMPRTLNA